MPDGEIELGAALFAAYGLKGLAGHPAFDPLIEAEEERAREAREAEEKRIADELAELPFAWVRSHFIDSPKYRGRGDDWREQAKEIERRIFRYTPDQGETLGNPLFRVEWMADLPPVHKEQILAAISILPELVGIVRTTLDHPDIEPDLAFCAKTTLELIFGEESQ